MSRILVLNGGAAVKQNLRGAMLSIGDPEKFFEKSGINTGDVLVYDAMLKQLSYESITNIQFSHAADERLWPDQEPDVTVIRGSNYLTATLDLGHTIPLLKKLRGAVVPVGVGAQAAKYGKLSIPKGSAEAWRIIASKCESIAVRGYYSAEIFNDLGIKNLHVIGCPSFYRSLQPSITLNKMPTSDVRFGLTLNRYLAADYASSTVKTNRMQRALLASVAACGDSRLYSQGEREESLSMFAKGDAKSALLQSALKGFGLENDVQVREMLDFRMSAHFDVDEWATDVGEKVDCMLGFRLHGNVIALHQGIPAIFFTYDSRIREIASLFHVPSFDIDDFLPVDLGHILDNADFSKFEAAYRNNYAEYYDFLNKNNLLHRMPAPVTGTEKPSSFVNQIKQNLSSDQIYKWMLNEVNFLAESNERLRTRAWNLETRLREMRGQPAA